MKLKKWFLLVLMMIILFPGINHTAEAQMTKRISVLLDGVPLTSDTAPYILPKLNITMVPLRVISEGLGATVAWSQSTKTVTIESNIAMIQLTNGKTTGLINGSTVSLDASVQIRNGRTMVPLRFVGEALGLQVNWDQADQTVTLISGAVLPDFGDENEGINNSALRGAWVSTVYNLDWPSAASYVDMQKQKEEYIYLIESLQAIGLNSVFVQIRPAGDALYPSALVPWSKTLTGKQGNDPGYDPLQFMIDETHARGMEFHAWFNPFRANTDTNTATLASNHVAIQHPEWIVNTKNQLIINPGIPEARAHVIDVIMEVVNNYNIDGVHLDDYFYPTGVIFNDESTFKTYNSKKIATKDNWRRDNVNQFVQQLNTSIQSVKPHIAFGVSPFGVWRNKASDRTGSDTKASITSYDDYYADVRTWIKNDWIDYVAPQLYWSLSNKIVQYDTLVNWWVNEVKGTDVELYIGHAPYKLGTTEIGWQNAQEIINQLKYNANDPEVGGSIFFSARHILNNPLGLIPALTTYYKQ
ncbi:family 10 glycosylhydrolase [Paenibacillus sp. FA6]|uniref:family 10 glycosylhydrolase n=1 Tax=Paenibacillus sp. FA6 TaxID=3413029 RepID=UPI003F656A26